MPKRMKNSLWALMVGIVLSLLVLPGCLDFLQQDTDAGQTGQQNSVSGKFHHIVGADDEQSIFEMDLSKLDTIIHEEIANRAAVWSVVVVDLDSQQMVICDNAGTADSKTVAASLIKLYILAVACDRIEAGLLTETESLKQYMHDMIVYSGNDAANAVLYAIGGGNRNQGMQCVNAWCTAQGYTATQINRVLGISNYSKENFTSAVDCSRLLTAIYNGTCVSPAWSQNMLSLLQQQTVTYKIPDGIPEQSNVVIGNKTGELIGLAEHDVAIVTGEGFQYVLCVLCEFPGRETGTIGEISHISELVYAQFSEATETDNNPEES